MGSWVCIITSPFKKVCTIFISSREKRHQTGHDYYSMNLQREIMACPYEDVHVMWSIISKTTSGDRNLH
ncbi:hypothetical protein M5K25_011407 [Dendrobium thyrsiflorum]|uniref:Uncharacterized protein n=1 Tax=Dendrobium thyrsiflorum TaxID=117978 RepID=A0ABD0V2Z4_DENTH